MKVHKIIRSVCQFACKIGNARIRRCQKKNVIPICSVIIFYLQLFVQQLNVIVLRIDKIVTNSITKENQVSNDLIHIFSKLNE